MKKDRPALSTARSFFTEHNALIHNRPRLFHSALLVWRLSPRTDADAGRQPFEKEEKKCFLQTKNHRSNLWFVATDLSLSPPAK